MTTPSAALDVALGLAEEADALTLAAFQQAMQVRRKTDGSSVTDLDVGVEAHLRRVLASEFPDHAFLGEESGSGGGADPDAPIWVIDPIDGTNNFVTGNPVFATLIALQVDGHEVMSVISAPALQTRWDAIIDGTSRRARCNGRPITVSDRELREGQVSFGGLRYFEEAGRGRAVQLLTRATRRQRGFGDFWQHCLVASGAVEVAVEAEVKPWDLAAVKCLVEAAGGRFSDVRGRRTIHGGDAISSNGVVHDEVLALMAASESAA